MASTKAAGKAVKAGAGAITTIDRDQLIETGARLRGAYLSQQGGATLELVRQEGPAFAAILPAGFLSAADEARRAVDAGQRDRANVAAESRDATRLQNETLRRAREWQRRKAALGRMARRFGAPVAEALTTIGSGGRSVPVMLKSMKEAVGILREQGPVLGRFPLYAGVLGEGESLIESLSTVDAKQEAKRLKELPEAVRTYYAAKGTLYTALKILNDAGRAYYSGDVTAAARFNLSILYRTPGRRLADPAKAGAP